MNDWFFAALAIGFGRLSWGLLALCDYLMGEKQ